MLDPRKDTIISAAASLIEASRNRGLHQGCFVWHGPAINSVDYEKIILKKALYNHGDILYEKEMSSYLSLAASAYQVFCTNLQVHEIYLDV